MTRITLFAATIATAALSTVAGAQSTRRAPQRRTTPSSGLAGAWHQVYTDPTVTVAIDTSQTRREGDRVFRTRLRWQYASSQPIGRRASYRTLVERKLIDCKTLGVKPVAAITYDAAGRSVSQYTTSESEVAAMDWSQRDPGSSAQKAYRELCSELR